MCRFVCFARRASRAEPIRREEKKRQPPIWTIDLRNQNMHIADALLHTRREQLQLYWRGVETNRASDIFIGRERRWTNAHCSRAHTNSISQQKKKMVFAPDNMHKSLHESFELIDTQIVPPPSTPFLQSACTPPLYKIDAINFPFLANGGCELLCVSIENAYFAYHSV